MGANSYLPRLKPGLRVCHNKLRIHKKGPSPSDGEGPEIFYLEMLLSSVVASNFNVDFESHSYFGVKFDLNVLLA